MNNISQIENIQKTINNTNNIIEEIISNKEQQKVPINKKIQKSKNIKKLIFIEQSSDDE